MNTNQRGNMRPEDAGIFRGFQIQYPEYAVVTPQTGLDFGVRGLTVSEVNKLKTSSMTPAKSTDLINRTIWGAIVNKPDNIITFDDFITLTTLKDREALIFGMYVTSFGDEREFNVSCSSCGTERPLKINMTDIFKINPYPGTNAMSSTYEIQRAADDIAKDPEMDQIVEEKQLHSSNVRSRKTDDPVEAAAASGIGFGDNKTPRPAPPPKTNSNVDASKPTPPVQTITGRPSHIPIDRGEAIDTGGIVDVNARKKSIPILGKEISVALPVSKVVAVIQQPTIKDETDILSEVSFARKEDTEIINETLVIKRFEVYSEESMQPIQIISRREDIIKGYQSLPVLDKKKIYEEFKDNFAVYGVELETNWDCFECEASNLLSLDIVTQFFRMVTIS